MVYDIVYQKNACQELNVCCSRLLFKKVF